MTQAASPTPPLEEPACPLCGSEHRRPAVQADAFLPFGVVRCERCGLHFLSPRPREDWAQRLYEGAGYFDAELGIEGEPSPQAGYHDYRGQEAALRLTFRRFLRALEKRGVGGGSLLEVGCGLGYLLDEARPFFDRRDGTEMSAQAALEAAKGCDGVCVGGIESAPDVLYDVVLSNHVIEHVYDPVAFLRAQADRVVPGGSVVASTPWMGSLWQRFLGEKWPSFKLPEHVLYFDRDSLVDAFHRAGLVDVRTVPYLHAFPAALIARKLGRELPNWLGSISIWIPQTTLAVVGRRPSRFERG